MFVNALDVTLHHTGQHQSDRARLRASPAGPPQPPGTSSPPSTVTYLFNGCVIGATVAGQPTPQHRSPPSRAQLNVGLTATLGAIEPLVAVAPPSLPALPGLLLVALPMLQVRPPQLTDPDVVPPNITYLDY